ncbi:hypothetical protein SFRURICE_008316 [Spodoptera frugiperda]|nr:hypothetical protein SFRURICE_008316 [Spodoptera frugiperda]
MRHELAWPAHFRLSGVTWLPPAHCPIGNRKEYVRYAKVFPLTETLDFKLPSKWYRRAVGGLEILFGLALAAIPSHKIKNTANIGLVLLMILAAYSHVMVGDPFDRCIKLAAEKKWREPPLHRMGTGSRENSQVLDL